MSSRTGGVGEPGKEPTRVQDQNRKVEKIEKIRSVDEAENERTRNKFQSYMNEEEESSKKNLPPSPFNTSFYTQEQSVIRPQSIEDVLNASAVPGPPRSRTPNVNDSPEPETNESPPLPRDRKFWRDVDSPPDQKTGGPHFRSQSEKHTKKGKGKDFSDKEGKEGLVVPDEKQTSIFGPPGKVIPEEKKKVGKKGKEEITIESPKEEHISKHKKKGDELLPSKDVQIVADEKQLHKDEKEDRRDQSKKTLEIEQIGTPHLPAHIIPIATEATNQVSSYLSPQTRSLFFQMVGTIYVMSGTPGISKTDIVLNSPGFANSRFYGATISIEKYATAPDSFNIRLTGTNEAVKSFKENLTNLYSAFQNGNFNFRVGRISAEYEIDKPVFRRKESGEGRSDTDAGGGDLSDRRGK